jgi:transposase
MPVKYVGAYSRGQKNDFRDAEAIAEAVQRPTTKFVATKTADQLDLQAQHRVRERLVRQRTGIIRFVPSYWNVGLRCAGGCTSCAPNCWASSASALTCCRMMRLIEDLAGDWRRLDERIESLSIALGHPSADTIAHSEKLWRQNWHDGSSQVSLHESNSSSFGPKARSTSTMIQA